MFKNNPILKEAYEEGNLYVVDKTIVYLAILCKGK